MSSGPVERTAAMSTLLVVGFVFLVAINGVTLWLVGRAQSDRERAAAARDLDGQLASVPVLLRRAETAQLGYLLLTREREHLSNFWPALEAVEPTLAAIKAGVAENPAQQTALEKLERVVTDRVDELREATVEPDRAVAIGVLVTELVLNAKKHAYPTGQGPIRVVLRAGEGRNAELKVEDDGVGHTDATRHGKGLGMKIVHMMSTKLGGQVLYDRSHKGTRAILTFGSKGGAPTL
jgi:anti-sigma regulatory factor (Ser/Thr protein kinase)